MINQTRDTVKDKLDVRVLSLLIFMSVVEFEVFVYARGVVAVAEQDAWLSILVGTLVLVINAYIMSVLAYRFPKKNFLQYVSDIWGKPIGFMIKISYLLYWFFTLSIVFEDFSAANKELFLPKTPKLVPLLLLAFCAYWVVSYGLAVVTRFYQILVYFLVIPLLLLAVLGISQINLDNLKPMLSHDLFTILKGAMVFAGIYQGLEVILFVGPFLTEPKKMVKPAIVGTIAGTFFPLVLSFSAVGSIGVSNLKRSIWPGIDTVSIITLPGFPVERYGLFLTMPWLIALFTTICIFLYLLAYGIRDTFNLNIDYRWAIIAVSVVLAVVATYLFPNYAWTLKMREHLSLVTFLFIAVLPFITLLLAFIRKKEGAE